MYRGSKEAKQCPGLHQEENHQQIKACAYSTQHLVGQQKEIRGLEVAERGEITCLPVPRRCREKYSICKDIYSDTRRSSGHKLL